MENKEQLIKQYVECYNCSDIDGMLNLLDESVVFENVSNGQLNVQTEGKSAFRDLANESVVLFSTRKQTLKDIDLSSNPAVANISFSAIIAADLPNGLKKGQELNLEGKSEFDFLNGKISRIRDIS